ncbi:recombinase family protein, partial [Pedobacter nanyangensis]|uniref:recombinase family protein n=1 Tax=Pedobacter nanyangensis TaxID=1562389 RepID=UPI000DE2D257
MTEILKVGIWIRVSTDRQVRDESPEHHEQRARYYIDAKGWDLAKIYRFDGISGNGIINHPEAQRMLNDVKNGEINGLVFSKLARLARSTKELLEFADIFRRSNAYLISLSENIDTSTPAGMLFFTVLSAMAEWEREEIASRVSASIPVRAKLGKPIGGQAIFGYSWKAKQFVLNEDEAPVRKLIFEIFLRTMRRKTTADELNRLGYRTRKGAMFSDTTIERLIRDTTVKGERIANYTRTGTGKKLIVLKPESDWIITECPQIVSPELWERANRILDEQKQKRAPVGRRSDYLLSGLLRCSCLKKMYVKNARIYKCRDCGVKIAISTVDEMYCTLLSESLNDGRLTKLVESSKTKLLEKQGLFNDTVAEKKILDERIDRYLSMMFDGTISVKQIKRYLQGLRRDLEPVEDLLRALGSEIDSGKLSIQVFEDHIKDALFLTENWSSMFYQGKRRIIENITRGILVGEREISIEFSIREGNSCTESEPLNTISSTIHHSFFHRNSHKSAKKNYPLAPRTIGEHLRKKRIDLGLTQAELGKILKVTPDCITFWENNRSEPQIKYYPSIYRFLGYHPIIFDETNFRCVFRKYYPSLYVPNCSV